MTAFDQGNGGDVLLEVRPRTKDRHALTFSDGRV